MSGWSPHGQKPGSSRGLFVTFEGIEGSGKTTQSKLLAEALAARNMPVVLIREPGATPMGETVRALLLDPKVAICPKAETLLFLAARAQNVAERIRPALEEGTTVICDRFADSTLAYQGYARCGDISTIRVLNDYSTGGLWPDLTILLDLDPGTGLSRQQNRNRMEDEPLSFHERVRFGYLHEARSEPERFAVLDAGEKAEELHRRILGLVLARLAEPRARS